MNSDFSFKKFQWKKVIAFALCLTMLLPSTAVFAASKSGVEKMELVIDTKGSTSGNASATYYYGSADDCTHSYEYTGKTIKPGVTVWVANSKNTSYKKASSSDYSIAYGKFNSSGKFKSEAPKSVGIYYAKVTFKGKYKNSGTRYIQFEIRPQKVTIDSVKASSNGKKATVKWKKLAKATVEKYQVGYSANKSFSNDQRIEYYYYATKAAKNSASSTTITNASYHSAKNYVRVRAYKTVTYYDEFGYKNYATIYGDWSKVKTVSLK